MSRVVFELPRDVAERDIILETRVQGEVKFFVREKGWGFITDNKTGIDIFFLGRDCGIDPLNVNEALPVSYIIRKSPDPRTKELGLRAFLIREDIHD